MTVIYTPVINGFLGFAPLTLSDWVYVLAAAALFLLAHEIIKAFKRSRRVPKTRIQE
jgi:Ca2+-transporting ATPase